MNFAHSSIDSVDVLGNLKSLLTLDLTQCTKLETEENMVIEFYFSENR